MLRRPALKKLINSFESDTVLVVDGKIHIKGFGSFKPSDVVACSKACHGDGQQKVVRLRVIVPESCECPETYDITVVSLGDTTSYETDDTFDWSILKEYEHPVGSSFTAAEAAAGLTEQLNLDKYVSSILTAVQTNSTGTPDAAGEYITLTQKAGAPDFNVFNPAGTVVVVTPYIKERLSDKELAKIFPIKPGDFGSRPTLPICGTYCRYTLKIRECCSDLSDAYDVSMDRAVQGTETEVEFYVNQDATNFAAYWDDKLTEQLPCLTEESSATVDSGIIIT